MGEVLTVLPFQNTLATFQISGKDVVAGARERRQPGRGRRRPLPAGGRPEIFLRQVGAAEAAASSAVEVMEGGAWKPIDPDKDYLVATNNYVRQGGDGYEVFADNGQERL